MALISWSESSADGGINISKSGYKACNVGIETGGLPGSVTPSTRS